MDTRRYFKFVAGFIGMIVLIFGGYFAWKVYGFNRSKERVRELAEDMDRIGDEARARAMADTYGGTTPQETLRMYIEAVEAGDYELASKYFVEEKREEYKKILFGVSAVEVENYVIALEDAIESGGSFSEDGGFYAIRQPGLIEFTRYPNGIWKIAEI